MINTDTDDGMGLDTSSHLFGDPAMLAIGASLLVQEGVEVEGLDATATPVFVPGDGTMWSQSFIQNDLSSGCLIH